MAKTFNDFFSNIVKNLKIPEYHCKDDLYNRLSSHPTLQAMLKYRNHHLELLEFLTKVLKLATVKFANVAPFFKQDTRNLKDNYRPISILFIISKIFEKLLCGQLSNHSNNILSKF